MFKTILELFEHRVNQSTTRPALRRKSGDAWEFVSWKEWWEESERLAAGLVHLGVEPGDRVCILADTRLEWILTDIAIQMAGAVSVPIFPSHLPALCRHIITDCEPRVVVANDPGQLDKLIEIRKDITSVTKVVLFDPEVVHQEPDWKGRLNVRLDDIVSQGAEDWVVMLDDLTASGRRAIAQDNQIVARRRRDVSADRPATIVYTSGTTDRPKGVVLTHENFASEVAGLTRLELLRPDDVQLLFLPLAHIFARILLIASIGYGIETALTESLRELPKDLQDVRPTFFAAVPQIFDRFRARLSLEAQRIGGVRAQLFELAEKAGRNASRFEREGRRLPLSLATQTRLYEGLVYESIRERFGGRIRFLVSGGAALDPELAEFYHAMGLLILEGYGLTETTAVATVNLPGDFRFGTVGRPVPGVDVTIAEDDEILVRGPTVMHGYWGDEEATAAVFDEEWFRTGDLGAFDRDGYLTITGRKKEIIVTAGGKNVSPTFLENLIEQSPFVQRALAYGDGRNFVTALVALEPDVVEDWADAQDIVYTNMAELSQHQRIHQLIREHIDAVNAQVAGFETIKKFAILESPFSEAGGELTPTGKLRRGEAIEKYRSILESFYAEKY